jgi:hypothetical protein
LRVIGLRLALLGFREQSLEAGRAEKIADYRATILGEFGPYLVDNSPAREIIRFVDRVVRMVDDFGIAETG